MILFSLIPLAVVVRCWWQQQIACALYRTLIRQLTDFRLSIRAAEPVAAVPDCDHLVSVLLRESIAQGHRLSGALAQCIQWLRTDVLQGQKANRLRLIWGVRMMCVVLVGVGARIMLCGRPSEIFFGTGAADRLLLFVAATVLLAGSALFCRLVPALQLGSDGQVSGLALWLRHRIQADNACSGASIAALQLIEEKEFRTGISLHQEKLEALDGIWRANINAAEARTETAGELMPLAEFLAFGAFLLAATGGPLIEHLL